MTVRLRMLPQPRPAPPATPGCPLFCSPCVFSSSTAGSGGISLIEASATLNTPSSKLVLPRHSCILADRLFVSLRVSKHCTRKYRLVEKTSSAVTARALIGGHYMPRVMQDICRIHKDVTLKSRYWL